jgi:N-acetylglutamate synthase-like GNAT family acetyltransferase
MAVPFSPSWEGDVKLRLATPHDIPAITALIDQSVRELQKSYYTPTQIDLALKEVYGVDSQLIADSTYFVVTKSYPTHDTYHDEKIEGIDEVEGFRGIKDLGRQTEDILACGGWSFRSTLYGGDQFSGREPASCLDPLADAARIRAFFVRPYFAKKGLTSMIYQKCEEEAWSMGWKRLEVGATLSGVAFYQRMGFKGDERRNAVMKGGEVCKYSFCNSPMWLFCVCVS